MLQEKCGIIGIFTPEKHNLFPMAFVAALGVQHRGQNGGGMVLQTGNKLIKETGEGLMAEIFNEKLRKNLSEPGNWILVHTRYGTNGKWLKENLQPCVGEIKKEKIVVVHNGEFVNLEKPNEDISDTPVFTQKLANTRGKNWEEKIKKVLGEVKGSYSLIIGIKNKLYFARDPFGIRPLVLGKIDNNWVIASETHALDKVGAKRIRWIRPGEIGRIDKKGLEIIQKGNYNQERFCDFEWAYFSRPDTLLPIKSGTEYKSVLDFRYKCGQLTAKKFKIRADLVVGVPDSGVPFATGFASEAKIPYRQMIIRDHFDINGNKRLFMGDSEINAIGKKVLGKLSLDPDEKNWKDKIVVIGDDSCVRGNVSKEITKAIKAMGAKEVHWIFGFPQVTCTCHLGVSMRTQEELIAFRCHKDVKKIAKEIGAESVTYVSNKDFIKARMGSGKMENPKEMEEIFSKNGGCGGCVTGKYPV
jgi:amidophosphoribosyltransferase